MGRAEWRPMAEKGAAEPGGSAASFKKQYLTSLRAQRLGSAFIVVPASAVTSGRTSAATRVVCVRSCAWCGLGTSLTSIGALCDMGTSLTSIGAWRWSDGPMSTRSGPIISPAIAHVSPSAAMDETMVSPAVAIAPLVPRADAEEDSVIEVARSVESDGSAGVGRIVVVAVGTDRRRASDANDNLRLSWWSEGERYK